MSLSLYNIKKWIKMFFGKSILHVNQPEGSFYSFESIRGYYNDLTLKVLKDKKHYSSCDVFPAKTPAGDEKYFSIGIFQYGLGAYDLLLAGKDISLMREKVLKCAEWAIKNQSEDGGWKTFEFTNPYSAMAQGQGISLLLRAYQIKNEQKYIDAVIKAMNFLINENNGLIAKRDNGTIFLEFANAEPVYNGWIFAIFGLIDFSLFFNNPEIKQLINETIITLINMLPSMDYSFWSMYQYKTKIASRFYHKLHIQLLIVLFKYTNESCFKEYADKFQKYDRKLSYRIKAFWIKAMQKIKE